MTNHSFVDCSIRDIRPYEHPDLWWSPTFLCWVFGGQTAVDNPYRSSNQIAEKLGLTPNPRAVQKLWIGWFRASGNEYEYARLASAVDIAHAYASQVFQLEMRHALVTSLRPFQLPPVSADEDALYYADRLMHLQLSSDHWSELQRDQFLDDLSLACCHGYCGDGSVGFVDRLLAAKSQSRS
jgi:hypothetical protein